MSKHQPLDTFLTVAEIAERLKLNQQTVRNMIDRGELPAIRVGARRIRVRERDLDSYLAAPATGAMPEGKDGAAAAAGAPQQVSGSPGIVSPASGADARDRFLYAALALVRELVSARRADLAPRLRALGREAELLADALESPTGK